MAARQRQRVLGIWPVLLLVLLSPLLALAAPARAQIGSARYSSIVIDATSGRVLQADNAEAPRHPASLAKLMTLYIAFEAIRDRRVGVNTPVPVSAHCASMQPTKLGLVPGGRLTVQQAILGLVTKSANDAACALGELLGGSEDRFAQMMTLRARALGMGRSTFTNASGLPDPDEWTTAHDMALLARRLLSDFPREYHYFSTPSFVFHGRLIPNHDHLLKSYPGADGLKTGYTEASGHNLVTSALRDGVRLIGVVLGAGSNAERDVQMVALLNQGFEELDVPLDRRPTRTAGRLALISEAHAATVEKAHQRAVHVRPEAMAGWGIQVGSFTNQRAARHAAVEARRKTAVGDVRVAEVRLRHKTWWRAQIMGLTESKAQEACDTLTRQRKARCVILRPEQQVVASR